MLRTNMRAALVVVTFILALGICPLSARIGETLEQCAKRYGKATLVPVVYDLGTQARELAYYNFQKSGIAIQIGFLNGKASDLSFQHISPPDHTVPARVFTQVEIDTLLAANSGGMHWKNIPDGKLTFFPDGPSPKARYGAYQQRDDGVMATIDGPALHVFTPEWMTYINAKMKAHNDEMTESQKKNLEGF
jgi:hypothetical protein